MPIRKKKMSGLSCMQLIVSFENTGPNGRPRLAFAR
jgi:hypothetical protein